MFSEIGAGVAFGPNAVKAMKLVDPELHQMYLSIAAKAPILEVDDGKGGRVQKIAWHHFIMGMDGRSRDGRNDLKALEDMGCTPYNDNRTHNVHRARFLEGMLELLQRKGGDERVTFNKRCTEIEDMGETVKVLFADGTSLEADAVIGCDGVKSRVRQILLRSIAEKEEIVEPRFTGKYAYRGLIPMEDAVAAIGERARVNLMICGYGGHLVTFPIEQGKTFNTVAFTSPKNECQKWEHGNEWIVKSTTEDILQDFEGWSDPVKRLLKMVRKPDKWALFEHPAASTYVGLGGKVLLLGDCAHASSPHCGAGAGIAIEDAALLVALVGKVLCKEELKRAFKNYNEERRERTQRLVRKSRETGLLYDFELEGVGDDLERLAADTKERYRWVWEFEIEEAVNAAKERFVSAKP